MTIEALFHDGRAAARGVVLDADASGCRVEVDSGDTEIEFAGTRPVFLRLTDPAKDRSLHLRARLTGLRRREGRWVFRFRWKALPELFVA